MNTINYGDLTMAYNFKVLFKGLEWVDEIDSKFHSVSGIKASLIHENDPLKIKDRQSNVNTEYCPVILRRSIADPDRSALRKWILKCLNESVTDPLPEVVIEILKNDMTPEITVILRPVYFKSWELGELNAQKSEVLYEELILDYENIEIIKGGNTNAF